MDAYLHKIRLYLHLIYLVACRGGLRMSICFGCVSNRSWQLILSAALMVAAGQETSAFGQTRVAVVPRARPSAKVVSSANIRLDVKLVITPVSVTDGFDRPLVELHKSNFHIYEDDAEQEISSFSISEAPVSVGVVFDSSRSMKSSIEDSRAAVEQFMTTAAAEDEFLLVKFSDKAELLTPFTRNSDEISRQLSLPNAHGFTALLDAICLATQQMRRAANPRKAILVLTDGVDNNSRYSERELERLVREADVRVYALGLFQRPEFLEKLAADTGGRALWVRRLSELPDAIQTLSRQIRSEYAIGYISHRPENDGKYHKVRVEVEAPGGTRLPIHTSWRHGYLALDE
jgi:Ca-activated chloride channel family protein